MRWEKCYSTTLLQRVTLLWSVCLHLSKSALMSAGYCVALFFRWCATYEILHWSNSWCILEVSFAFWKFLSACQKPSVLRNVRVHFHFPERVIYEKSTSMKVRKIYNSLSVTLESVVPRQLFISSFLSRLTLWEFPIPTFLAKIEIQKPK